ncbi:MAG: LacI family transcriptional regulator [Flavobacteriaceae bacterium]|nr:MAG: LacI family transcriptional regulator [Flavobacteriaceae bacterium]
MSGKTTIYDIAKQLNITAATVSRALNDHPRISQDTKELVLKTAKELNYEQNKLALALKSGKTYLVGVVVPYINRNFFSNVIRGIEDELYPKGYRVIISQTHEEEEKEIETIKSLLNAQVDGILMSISKPTTVTEHFDMIIKKNVPLVFFDRKKDIPGVSTVTIDDFEGGYKATEHLIQQGCKKIAHVSVYLNIGIYKDRFEGYKKALLDNGLAFREEYIIQTESQVKAGKKALDDLFKLNDKPDAIFTSSDHIALGVMQQLKKKEVKVPDDFCVVGFSNEPFTKFMELPISSVDQSPIEMGRMSAKVFLEQINSKKKVKIEKKVVLPPKLHIRKSSLKE